MITKRQSKILNKIVQEYINSARPIPSQLLEKKYKFGISPATIRIEMQRLTDWGFLYQPHTSAGRIPTDKGFRFFVDNLFAREKFEFPEKRVLKEIKKIEREIEDILKFSQQITKILASFSSNLAVSYLLDKKIFWKEGWEEILSEPEFENADFMKDFITMVQDFEKHIEDFVFGGDQKQKIKVYIGREVPFSRSKDFSLIISQSKIPPKKRATLAILGPKRMAYQKNIGLINSVVNILERI
jgi:transcriptional regulator of heat shock response